MYYKNISEVVSIILLKTLNHNKFIYCDSEKIQQPEINNLKIIADTNTSYKILVSEMFLYHTQEIDINEIQPVICFGFSREKEKYYSCKFEYKLIKWGFKGINILPARKISKRTMKASKFDNCDTLTAFQSVLYIEENKITKTLKKEMENLNISNLSEMNDCVFHFSIVLKCSGTSKTRTKLLSFENLNSWIENSLLKNIISNIKTQTNPETLFQVVFVSNESNMTDKEKRKIGTPGPKNDPELCTSKLFPDDYYNDANQNKKNGFSRPKLFHLPLNDDVIEANNQDKLPPKHQNSSVDGIYNNLSNDGQKGGVYTVGSGGSLGNNGGDHNGMRAGIGSYTANASSGHNTGPGGSANTVPGGDANATSSGGSGSTGSGGSGSTGSGGSGSTGSGGSGSTGSGGSGSTGSGGSGSTGSGGSGNNTGSGGSGNNTGSGGSGSGGSGSGGSGSTGSVGNGSTGSGGNGSTGSGGGNNTGSGGSGSTGSVGNGSTGSGGGNNTGSGGSGSTGSVGNGSTGSGGGNNTGSGGSGSTGSAGTNTPDKKYTKFKIIGFIVICLILILIIVYLYFIIKRIYFTKHEVEYVH